MRLANTELIQFILRLRTTFFKGNIFFLGELSVEISFDVGVADTYLSESTLSSVFEAFLRSKTTEVRILPYNRLNTGCPNLADILSLIIINMKDLSSVDCDKDTLIAISPIEYMKHHMHGFLDEKFISMIPKKPASITVEKLASISNTGINDCIARVKKLALLGLICTPLPTDTDFSSFKVSSSKQNLISVNPFAASSNNGSLPIEKHILPNIDIEQLIKRSNLERGEVLKQLRSLISKQSITVTSTDGREFC